MRNEIGDDIGRAEKCSTKGKHCFAAQAGQSFLRTEHTLA